MNSVQIEQESYEMPPREGFGIAHFLTVADIGRSAHYYERVFGARILSLGDGNAPGYLQLANIWMILNVGGGPTEDKPTVTLSVPDPNHINSFLNFRVADIQACYELWKGRGAEFITKPIPKYGETRCYIRDPDGYIIEVGQSNPDSSTVKQKAWRPRLVSQSPRQCVVPCSATSQLFCDELPGRVVRVGPNRRDTTRVRQSRPKEELWPKVVAAGSRT